MVGEIQNNNQSLENIIFELTEKIKKGQPDLLQINNIERIVYTEEFKDNDPGYKIVGFYGNTKLSLNYCILGNQYDLININESLKRSKLLTQMYIVLGNGTTLIFGNSLNIIETKPVYVFTPVRYDKIKDIFDNPDNYIFNIVEFNNKDNKKSVDIINPFSNIDKHQNIQTEYQNSSIYEYIDPTLIEYMDKLYNTIKDKFGSVYIILAEKMNYDKRIYEEIPILIAGNIKNIESKIETSKMYLF